MKAKRKMDRLDPVAKVRKREMDVIASQASQLERQIRETATELKASQDAYMRGVNQLNTVRTSGDRQNLLTLETSVDSLKEKWHSLYHKLNQLKQAKQQVTAQLRLAQRNMKAVEVLQDKYQAEFRKELDRQEQNFLDEAAIRSFNTNQTRNSG